MNVLFAPDWRNGVPYQRLLAEALERAGARVNYLQGYKRVLPLTRLLATNPCDILHLHWPEAYYPKKSDHWDWFRRARFAFDLKGALKHCRLATTAHNLHAHNRAIEPFAARNTRVSHQLAGAIFAHSDIAKQKLIAEFDLNPQRVVVIPHGDLSVVMGNPVAPAEARKSLALPDGKIALMFGAIEPYKGQEELIRWWRKARPDASLAIVGLPISPEYGSGIQQLAGDDPRIIVRAGWLADDQLRLWLSAADVIIFNYREIFTSGAANLARSWGTPMLLPDRLETVILDEPSPFVHRFSSFTGDFGAKLQEALRVPPDFAAARDWRKSRTWDQVAAITMDGYRMALGMT